MLLRLQKETGHRVNLVQLMQKLEPKKSVTEHYATEFSDYREDSDYAWIRNIKKIVDESTEQKEELIFREIVIGLIDKKKKVYSDEIAILESRASNIFDSRIKMLKDKKIGLDSKLGSLIILAMTHMLSNEKSELEEKSLVSAQPTCPARLFDNRVAVIESSLTETCELLERKIKMLKNKIDRHEIEAREKRHKRITKLVMEEVTRNPKAAPMKELYDQTKQRLEKEENEQPNPHKQTYDQLNFLELRFARSVKQLQGIQKLPVEEKGGLTFR